MFGHRVWNQKEHLSTKRGTLLGLPPSSPPLAPAARVWKLARRMATHNRFVATLDAVWTAVSTGFDR